MQRKGDWIATYTGVKFYPFDPRPEDIRIRDIAHALAYTCRFNGHCKQFYSVAEHSIWISRFAGVHPMPIPLWALLHDAAEAYISDVPRPIKYCGQFAFYQETESILLDMILRKYGIKFSVEGWAVIGTLDSMMLYAEARDLMENGTKDWNEQKKPAPINIVRPMAPEKAEIEFIKRFDELNRRDHGPA